MTDLPVKTVKLFGGDYYADGSQTEIAEFGSAKAGSPTYSVDPDDIQNAAYEAGWEDALIIDGNKRIPQKQDFNALAYLSSYFLSYLYRAGIAEYKATSFYNNTCIVREAGTAKLYQSLVSDNQGNALSDNTKWSLLVDLANIPIITDWVSYTPTVSNLGAGSGTATGRWRRVGDTMEIMIYFVKDATPGSGTGNVSFSIPSTYTIDTSKLPNIVNFQTALGSATTNGMESSANFYQTSTVVYISSTTVGILNVGSGTEVYQGADFRAPSTTGLQFSVPIVGW